MRKIAYLLLLIIVSVLLIGAGRMYPSMIGATVPAGGSSFNVTPTSTNYIFAFSADQSVSVISMRITPTNQDPEYKKWCYNTRSCEITDYNYDTSQDYIIYAGASGVGGYLLWEPN